MIAARPTTAFSATRQAAAVRGHAHRRAAGRRVPVAAPPGSHERDQEPGAAWTVGLAAAAVRHRGDPDRRQGRRAVRGAHRWHGSRARAPQAREDGEPVRRPGQPGGAADRVAGLVAHPRAGLGVRAALGELRARLGPDRLPAAAVQHGRHRPDQHDRDARVVHARGLRLRPVPVPRSRPALHARHRHDLPAGRRHGHPDLHDLRQARLGRDLAAVAGAGVLRQRLRRVPDAPVLPDDPDRDGRGGRDRRRRARSGPSGRSCCRRPGRSSSRWRSSTWSIRGTTSSGR